MKYRSGFISNSSSASFVVNLNDITPLQRYLIENHIAEAKKIVIKDFLTKDHPNEAKKLEQYFNESSGYDAWEIEIKDNNLVGYTSMANFDMESFLKLINVDLNKVKYEHDG
jgi:hypothetical protein